MVTPETVARFFELVWPLYGLGQPVRVELIRPWAKSCPIQGGFLGWDAGGHWRIIARPYDENPRHLLGVLFHEMRHALRGDIKPGTPANFAELRALASGRATEKARRAEVAQLDRERTAKRPMEDDCTDWGDAQAWQWWPTLEEWQDPHRAAAAVRWVYNATGGIE